MHPSFSLLFYCDIKETSFLPITLGIGNHRSYLDGYKCSSFLSRVVLELEPSYIVLGNYFQVPCGDGSSLRLET